jgi:hypothetical protein
MTVTIYKVTCRPTGECYVGSTSQPVEARWNHHRSRLNAGWHRSRRLQFAWRKFGAAAFTFEVVQVVPERERNAAEWRHMRSSNSTFNALDERGVRR